MMEIGRGKLSFFIAGFGIGAARIKDLKNSFSKIVPRENRNNIIRFEGSQSFLVNFGANKPIKDFAIIDKMTGSWLAIIGTPLLDSLKDEDEPIILERFFRAPDRIVKNELDGCFAVLAYNRLTDTYYAATDYNNTIPIFYAPTASGLYLSSHELPLARFLHSEIDPFGFALTIHLKLTWGAHTRFKNIHKLLPCQIMTFIGNTKLSYDNYWSPSEENQWPEKFNFVMSSWLTILEKSIQAYYHCSENKKVICDITAGEDSRLLLSQCHALKIPFLAMVDGLENDMDVLVSKEAAAKTGFDLLVRPRYLISNDQLAKSAIDISLMHEGYEDYFSSCTAYATDAANSPKYYEYVKFCGAPGGEVYRGSYYLRGKAFFPSKMSGFDYNFFTRMKYMLDFYSGLLRFSDQECKEAILAMVKEALEDVSEFPVGIKIDHLLRLFQTSNTGLIYKNPRYLPFSTKYMVRSIYQIPPNFKKGGRLTKACTEILFPELAWIKTQKGVPTVRRTLLRTYLFMPEYVSTAKSIMSGALSRLLKWTESNKPAYKRNMNAPAIMTLVTKPPFSNWFSSSRSMITGYLYNQPVLDSVLAQAKGGAFKYIPILGRIINQELACRWVYSRSDLPPLNVPPLK
jgi:hypothetical protein